MATKTAKTYSVTAKVQNPGYYPGDLATIKFVSVALIGKNAKTAAALVAGSDSKATEKFCCAMIRPMISAGAMIISTWINVK